MRYAIASALIVTLCANTTAASTDGPAVGIDPLRPKMYHSPKHGFLIAKPEEWALVTSPAELERECVGLVIEDSDELVWEEGLAAVTNLTPLQPSGLLAVPFGPRVEVDVYRITASLDEATVVDRVIEELVRGLQAIPDMYAQVVVPPNDIRLNGKSWRTAEVSAKMRLGNGGEGAGAHDVHTRVEIYAYAAENKLFLVQFVARTFDVPEYRPAVRQIIGSITLVKPPVRREPIDLADASTIPDVPALAVETHETSSIDSSAHGWKDLWGLWRRQ